jgi:hypothetical protein
VAKHCRTCEERQKAGLLQTNANLLPVRQTRDISSGFQADIKASTLGGESVMRRIRDLVTQYGVDCLKRLSHLI